MRIFACTARVFLYNEYDELEGESLFCGVTNADCEEIAEQKTIKYLKKIMPLNAKIHTILVTDRYFENTYNFEQYKSIIVEE